MQNNKPDMLWVAMINCNKDYKKITQERKRTKKLLLKNVTPTKEEAKKLEEIL